MCSFGRLNWGPHRHNGTVTSPRVEEKRPVYQPSSLAHAQNAQAASKSYLGQIEAWTVIADRKLNRAVLDRQSELNGSTGRVFQRVSECFLSDAV